MFYAHQGNSSDNAFTTYDGFPTRAFVAFETKKERKEAQEKIWAESNRKENLIFCTRKMVEEYHGRDFVIVKGVVYSDYEAAEI
jgi:hypothetical protein